MCTRPKLIAPFHKARLLEVEVAIIQFKKMTLVRALGKQCKKIYNIGLNDHAPATSRCMCVGALILKHAFVFFRTENRTDE